MKIFYGLAVALFLFEGIIIQCEGANEFRDAPVIDEQYLPDHLIGEILSKAGLNVTKEMAQAQMKVAGDAIRRVFETRIIAIQEYPDMAETIEVYDGEQILLIRNHTKLMSLFEQFGSHARRIHISYESMDKERRREINEKIMKRCANQLTELQILTRDDTGIWEEMSNGKRDIRFPKVEHFIFLGSSKRNKFDLNAIFPRLKFFSFPFGSVTDTNCLANVRNLKELKLYIESIQEHQLGNIFANNKHISKLTLKTHIRKTIKRETLRSIESLKNLKTLEINKVSPDFFNRASNRVYNLTSVTTFVTMCREPIKLNRDFSFDMPNLKHLRLCGTNSDNRTSDLINHFKSLETVLLFGDCEFNVIECIESLKYVKEFTTSTYFNIGQISLFRKLFENFDTTKSNLNKLVIDIDETESEYFLWEDAMREINNKLKESNKPTWTLSHGIWEEFRKNHLEFKRNT
ncbi:uncharacterized protein LOC116339611 [Contarinia nasturtii]|uniref:uncharacterized protein LOC116339611 n=1 Tax=Contarinia nasturtii TaxID=265458 RepID=UPI0012D44C3D|nr:uncharacterized protein LOC116339611 [Contarinia nasturtii]